MKVTRQDSEAETVLRIEGSLDALSTVDLRPVMDQLFTDKRRQVTLDLSALRLIDSSGVGAIVSLYKRLRQDGGTLKLQGLRDQPMAIFKLLRLDRVFSL